MCQGHLFSVSVGGPERLVLREAAKGGPKDERLDAKEPGLPLDERGDSRNETCVKEVFDRELLSRSGDELGERLLERRGEGIILGAEVAVEGCW